MIGGYAQLAYDFNYYGTVGCNRDEFIILRKMEKVDWMNEEGYADPFCEDKTTPCCAEKLVAQQVTSTERG